MALRFFLEGEEIINKPDNKPPNKPKRCPCQEIPFWLINSVSNSVPYKVPDIIANVADRQLLVIHA